MSAVYNDAARVIEGVANRKGGFNKLLYRDNGSDLSTGYGKNVAKSVQTTSALAHHALQHKDVLERLICIMGGSFKVSASLPNPNSFRERENDIEYT